MSFYPTLIYRQMLLAMLEIPESILRQPTPIRYNLSQPSIDVLVDIQVQVVAEDNLILLSLETDSELIQLELNPARLQEIWGRGFLTPRETVVKNKRSHLTLMDQLRIVNHAVLVWNECRPCAKVVGG